MAATVGSIEKFMHEIEHLAVSVFRLRQAIFRWWERLFESLETDPSRQRLRLLGSLIVCAVAIRILAIPATTKDTFQTLLPWLEYAERHGTEALGQAFTNYTPFYQYLLVLATAVVDVSALPYRGWPLIKIITYGFEFINSWLVFRIVLHSTASLGKARIGALTYLLLPTVLWNSALWGQADAIWTCFVLASVLASLRQRHLLAVLLFGVALSVKAQAIFLSPFLLGRCFEGRIPFAYFLLVPLTYVFVGIPALLGGYDFQGLLQVYLQQGNTFERLSMNAPNLWYLVPDAWYREGVVVGLSLACVLALGLAVVMRASRPLRSPLVLLYFATLALGLIPYVLPKMHERYFHAYEVFVLILAMVDARYLRYVLLVQAGIGLSYLPFQGLTRAGMPLAIITVTCSLILLCLDPPTELASERRRIALARTRLAIENFLTLFALLFFVWCLALIGVLAFVAFDLRAYFPISMTGQSALAFLIVLLACLFALRRPLLQAPASARPEG
ncbi:MAG: hypothetical protein ACREXK_01890 [Gammaproteobacteria bacterium]